MIKARLVVVLTVVVALGCSENKNPEGTDAGASFADAAVPCSTRFAVDDAGQPATITVDTSAVVNTFVPKLLFGNNVAWYFSKRDLQATQAKVQAAGNYFLRYPGGSSSDDHHWNGTGSYDTNHYWVPSPTSFTPGFSGTERFRGTTSGSYQTPAFITDGDPATRWLSNVNTASPAEQWVYVDLGQATSVDAVAISWGTPFAASFRVETWSSTAAWPPPYWATSGSWQATSAGTMTGTEGVQTVSFTPVTTRFIRVLMTASSAGPNGAYSIAEIVAYSGSTQVTSNVASMRQSPTTVSSTDPANDREYQVNVDFESFMTYIQSFTPPADPIITVNVGTGTPQEAAAWVHYANVVKRYGIHYWQIGNEMEGNWETGGPLNARDYVSRYVQYYDAMKAEDPSVVVLGPVSGGMNEPSNLGDGKNFIEDFIHILDARGQSDHVDGIDFHWYPNWESVSDRVGLGTVSQLGDFSSNLRSWLAGTGVRADVPVFLTEFNMGLGAANPPAYLNRLVNGLWLGKVLGEYIRYFGKGGGTNLWNVISTNSTADSDDRTAGDLGYLQVNDNPYRYQEHANYWAMQMMSSNWAIPGDTRDHQLVAATSSESSLAAYADLRPDGALTLAVVNLDAATAYSTSISLAPFVPGPAAEVWTFGAANYVWETTTIPYHAEPDLAPTHSLACGSGGTTPFTFPPASITVIRFAPSGAPTAVMPDAGPAPGNSADASTNRTYVAIDDMEGTGNGPIELALSGPDIKPGSWWDWHSTGDASNTESPDPFVYSAVPSPHETMPGITSSHAAHVACRIADLYGYCEEGFNLAMSPVDGGETSVPYDISHYSGLVFWGRSPTANRVKVMVQNIDTDAKGGRCGTTDASLERCWDNFCTYVTFTDSWQRFEVKFSEFEQEGWGHAAPGGVFDSTKVYSIYFAVNGPGKPGDPAVNADVWIDDIYFVE